MRLLEKIDLEKDRPLKCLVNSCTWDVVALIFVMIDGGWGACFDTKSCVAAAMIPLNCKAIVINQTVAEWFVYVLRENHAQLHPSGIEPLTLCNRPIYQPRPRLRLKLGSQLSHWLFLALIRGCGRGFWMQPLGLLQYGSDARLWPLYDLAHFFVENVDLKRTTTP